MISQPLQMLVKQRETQRQIQNAETEKQLQQALSQVTDISKALEEIRLCYQNQVSVSVYLRMIMLQVLCRSCDDYVGGKCLNLPNPVSPVLYIMCKKIIIYFHLYKKIALVVSFF